MAVELRDTHTDWAEPRSAAATVGQFRAFLDEVGQWTTQDDLSDEAFFDLVLKRVVNVLAADGAVVWKQEGNGAVRLFCQENPPEFLTAAGETALQNSQMLLQALSQGACLAIPPDGDEDGAQSRNPSGFLVLLAPVRSESEIAYLLQLFQSPDSAALAARRDTLRVTQRLSQLAEHFLKNAQIRRLRDRAEVWGQVEHFHNTIHRHLQTRDVSYAVANEGRSLIDCDRVSIALRRGQRFQLVAVSGQESVDGRSPTFLLLNGLVTAAVQADDALWYSGSTDAFAPQIERALNDYVEQSHATRVGILPIHLPEEATNASRCAVEERRPIGALIVEQFETGGDLRRLVDRAEIVSQHSALALANALRYEGLFLSPVWQALGKSRWFVEARNLPKATIASAVALLAVAILTFVPYDFEILAIGELQAGLRREVFAPSDGTVDRILVRHGDSVTRGQLLAELRNTDLDVQVTDLIGQRAAAQAQLASIERQMFEHGKRLSAEEQNRLAGQRSELHQRLTSLTHQLQLLQRKLERLRIESPLDGEVTTWNVAELLYQRPVRQGQVLLNVADPLGEWELELRVPEDQIGYVARAQRDLRNDLPVTYRMATDPLTDHLGSVIDVHRAAEIRGEEGNTVLVRVQIDKSDLGHLQSGAECRAKVYCGRRALGYVLFHDLVAFIHSRILFRL
jgi:multidrug efflux pump subunit AcrA (membrane-fusion protein)